MNIVNLLGLHVKDLRTGMILKIDSESLSKSYLHIFSPGEEVVIKSIRVCKIDNKCLKYCFYHGCLIRVAPQNSDDTYGYPSCSNFKFKTIYGGKVHGGFYESN